MDDDAWLRSLPKVQLHCHLEGTLRPARFLELARTHGYSSERTERAEHEAYAFETFHGFLQLFQEVSKVLRTPDDYAALAADYADDAIAQGVVRAEVFISPSVWQFFHPGIDVRACIAAIRHEFAARAARGLTVELIVDLTRNFGPQRALDNVRAALEWLDLGVIGIGLGGDEAKFPATLFREAFDLARRHGLHVVAHAGEADGAHSVRAAVEVLGAERIGHGVRAIEDPRVVALLVERRVPLEICPTSNRLTGAAPADAPHPLAALDAAGVRVTIDADDPALFGTTLLAEYETALALVGRGRTLGFVRNAIEASFAPEEQKAGYRRLLESAFAGT